METNFSPEFFKGNRNKLRALFTGSAPIVITANGQLQRNGDTTFPFRQDSNFWYLTGIELPDLVLVIDKVKEYLILPERSNIQDIFDGNIDADRLSIISGVKQVFSHKDGWRLLSSRLQKVKHVATLAAAPAYVDSQGFYTNPARANLNKLMKQVSSAQLLDLRAHLAMLRSVKQPQELVLLQTAIDITSKTLKQIKPKLTKFGHEFEVEAEITRSFRQQGADGHGYQPIVAGGLNATVLHYVANNAALNKKQLLLLDVGAEYSNYTADITRTYSLSEPNKRQKAIHAAVIEVQEFAISKLKPGLKIADYEKEVENFMGEKLRELLLIKTISRENVRKYCPHAMSHFLGLDAHDAGDYTKPLKPNMVLTVEPGIYIPEEAIGVRIEDDILITDDSAQVLSANLPRTLW